VIRTGLGCAIKAWEGYETIGHLKTNKNQGLCGLSSDYFTNGPQKFRVHIAFLFIAMLVHGFNPSLLTV
jgi:hypothetical protein